MRAVQGKPELERLPVSLHCNNNSFHFATVSNMLIKYALKTSTIAALGAMALMVAPTHAADLPSKKSAPVAALPIPFNWNGLYVGASVGVGLSGTTVSAPAPSDVGNANSDNVGMTNYGLTTGFQAGYNFQISPSVVVGIEGEVGYLGTSRRQVNVNDPSLIFKSKSDFFGTLRPRIGYAWDRSLLFVTGGLAVVNVKNGFEDFGPPLVSTSHAKVGYAVGAGLETALSSNWSVKAEYLYIDAGRTTVTDPATPTNFLKFKNQYQVARFGLNYRFGDVGKISPESSYNWSGFYAGLNLGTGAAATNSVPSNGIGQDGQVDDIYAAAFTGGVQAGYNAQFSKAMVVGAEADFGFFGASRTICDINDCGSKSPLLLKSKSSYLGTARLRAGYAFDRSMIYATGGLAVMGTKNSFTNFGGPFISASNHKVGLAVGAGIETALTDKMSLKAEYLYVDTGHATATDPNDNTSFIRFKNSANVFRFGVNYKFGG